LDDKERAIRQCKRGHSDWYPNGKCRACAINRAAEWTRLNLDRAKENWARSHARPEARLVKKRNYERNKDAVNLRSKEWHQANPQKVLEINRKWVKSNKHKRAIYNTTRRKAVVMATPKWADLKEIEKIYKKSQELTASTGVRYSVDHVIPLKNKSVCGLHVHQNLAVIPYVDNCKKSNCYHVD
jgi:hypothetical protein